MRIWFVFAWVCAAAVCGAAPGETNVFEQPDSPQPAGEIDRLVFAQLAEQHLQPRLCSDAVFIRRIYLDVLGKLPTAKEASDFLQDADRATKRARLIEAVLNRPEFADYWAMKWGDILRIKAEFPVNLWPNAAQAYHHWVKESLAHNKPYNQFARELLTSSGSNFRVGPVNFYRAIQNRTPEGIARAVALTFMGARAELWPTNQLAGMTAFFSQIGYKPTGEWKEEIVFWDPLGLSGREGAPGRAAVTQIAPAAEDPGQFEVAARTNLPPAEGVFPDGTRVKLGSDRDPREVFADWLIRPENPWFTRAIVNRVWAWLLGRGIIQEPDDIRADNPPSNPALLACLEKELVADHYDLKRFYQFVLNSQTYQLSPLPQRGNPNSRLPVYYLRRLDAEVLGDAINEVTGTSDLYTSPIPEPFTYIPKDVPAVALPDGSISSPFLALFGRSARATGMENERDNKPTPAQWLFLLNSSDLQRKLEQGTNIQAIVGFGGRSKPAARIAQELYLTILSRLPTQEEMDVLSSYGGSPRPNSRVRKAQPDRSNQADRVEKDENAPSAKPVLVKTRQDWLDVAWALINSEEFLYRH